MNEPEHLTSGQIAGYYAGTFAEAETHEIGRHLLFCASCRKRLPAQTAEGFLSALMSEREATAAEEIPSAERAKFSLPVLPIVSAFFTKSRVLAWGGAAVIVLFSLSFFIWFGAKRQSNAGGGDLAQTFETEFENGRNKIRGQTISPPIQSSENHNSVSSIKSNPSVPVAKPTYSKSDSLKDGAGSGSQKISDRNPERVIIPNDKKEIIASTRGGESSVPKCADEAEMTTDAAGDGGAVTLKWKRIPKAAKYHLYVSDDEEILLDEFETATETSYVLTKPLDRLKTYKWKIVVTLEDGTTIVGDAQKFTVNDLNFNKKRSNKKEKSEIRCSEEK